MAANPAQRPQRGKGRGPSDYRRDRAGSGPEVRLPKSPLITRVSASPSGHGLISTNRSQSKERPLQHRAEDRGAAVAAQCSATRSNSGDGYRRLGGSEDYRAFEAAVIADYDARTAVERELVLRLASPLWRLRRIISIETDLLKIQSDIVSERRSAVGEPPLEAKGKNPPSAESPLLTFDSQPKAASEKLGCCDVLSMSIREPTCCFLRLNNVDNGAFERPFTDSSSASALRPRFSLRHYALRESAIQRAPGR
jgi:hypothetical protein